MMLAGGLSAIVPRGATVAALPCKHHGSPTLLGSPLLWPFDSAILLLPSPHIPYPSRKTTYIYIIDLAEFKSSF